MKPLKFTEQNHFKFLDNSEIKSDILYRRGGSHERLKDYKKADEDLLLSLKLSPDQPYVLNYLAYSWLERKIKIEQSMEMLWQLKKHRL